jgi:uncharacterized protein YegL
MAGPSMPNIMGGTPNPAPLSTRSGSQVPGAQAGKTRTPVLFLIDVSGSTGEGDNPDLPQMEVMLSNMVEMLKQPPSQNALAANASVVDIAIVTYSNDAKLIQEWEQANKLPPVEKLFPLGGTNTATALLAALDYVTNRIRYYDSYKPSPIPKSIPHIFHFTDGAPTDVVQGDEMWLKVQELLKVVSGDKEKPFSMISHFVSPNGMIAGHSHLTDAQGQPMSGYDALSQWTGTDNVYELMDAPDKFTHIVRVILKSVGGATAMQGRINDLLKKYNVQAIPNPKGLFGQPNKKTGTDR